MWFYSIKFQTIIISCLFVASSLSFDLLDGLGGEKNGENDLLDVVKEHGHPVERYFVPTADKYILGLYRIPPKTKAAGKVVFLMHAMFFSAADYLTKGPKKALAYMLADAGYDVWLGNSRGNTWSRNHSEMDPDGKNFWNFTWHEIGVHDLPALIDFILTKTNEPNLHYIGHSQATTSLVVLLSEQPEYNKKIKSAHFLAPVTYVRYPSPLPAFLAANLYSFENAANMFDLNEFFAFSSFFKNIASMGCNEEIMTHTLCSDAYFAMVGRSESQYSASLLPEIFSYAPAGTSFKTAMHFGQLIQSGKFQKYDYKADNQIVYGQPTPPEYKISNIKVKIQAFYGTADLVLSKKDAEENINLLGDNVINTVVMDGWNHLDFLYGKDADKLVYPKIMEKMSSLK